MRVLFWGTSSFAVPSLLALVGESFDVVGAVTQPDRPIGRSRSEHAPPPVKLAATEHSLPVLQPERPRGDEFLDQLRALEPELSVVASYGHILTDDVIALPAPRSFGRRDACTLIVPRAGSAITSSVRMCP